MKSLIVNNLKKRYKKSIIYNFSYEFINNKIYAIIGKSGKGKTTLLKIVANVIKRYKGEIYYNKKLIKKLKNYTFETIGFVYQDHQLLDNLTALENVMLYFKLKNEKEEKHYYKAKLLFKYFNVLPLLNKKVKFLSLGEKQRVAFIRAIIKNPDILLLDEPTSALDNNSKELLISYLKSIKKEKIIIIVTHDQKVIDNADEIIDFDNIKTKSINKISISKSLEKEKKLKFYNLKNLYKKVFKSKKIFNYISSGILSFGLISICLSFVIKDFINDVINTSFIDYDTSNYITLQSKLKYQEINFQEEFKDAIYYQGLESTFKEKIKQNSYITHLDFNYYDIKNTLMIFDNYLSEYEENIVLAIPIYLNEYIKSKNSINVYHNKGYFSIFIDKVIYSEDDTFYLYSNNVSYLLSYFLSNNIEPIYSYFLYSKNSNENYQELINNNKYHNYYFYKEKDSDIIQIFPSNISRICKNSLLDFINENKINNYIISDYLHTYIDYHNGLIYLLESDDKACQIVIDNSLSDNIINVTSKYIKDKENKESIKLFDKRYYINEIQKDDSLSIIYMNYKTLNSINNQDLIYCVLIETNNQNIKSNDLFMLNEDLINLTSISVFSYITNFILFFAIIIFLLALLTTSIVFSINLNSKKKEIQILKNFGLYNHKIFRLFLYDPISNILTSIVSCIVSIILSKVLISILYYNMSSIMLDINISITMIVLVSFLPFLVIIPLTLFKIIQFINKNY